MDEIYEQERDKFLEWLDEEEKRKINLLKWKERKVDLDYKDTLAFFLIGNYVDDLVGVGATKNGKTLTLTLTQDELKDLISKLQEFVV